MRHALSDDQLVALAYVCEHPGVTTPEVAAGAGLPRKNAQRSLEALYTKKLLGRQHNLLGFRQALWFPEAHAVRMYQEATT